MRSIVNPGPKNLPRTGNWGWSAPLPEPYKFAMLAFQYQDPKENQAMIKPTFHHVNLKTTRLQEMNDWYGVVVGATVNLQSHYPPSKSPDLHEPPVR
jgi:hypothetical protein